jgi:hypothetical protein
MLPFGHRLAPGGCRRRRAQSSKKKGDILVKKLLLTTVAFGVLALPAMAADNESCAGADVQGPDPGSDLHLDRLLHRRHGGRRVGQID